jgi:uncharacterized membrane protein YqjE
MADPESFGSGESPGLFVSLRSFWSVLVAILYTRLDLVTAELEDEGVRLIKCLGAGLLSVLCLYAAFFVAMFFLVVLAWDSGYILWIIGGIFVVYFLGGILCLVMARNMIMGRPKFLSQTLAELRRDVEGLRQAMPVKPAETKP